MEEAKIIITKTKGIVTIEGENISMLDYVVMCHAMVKDTASRLGINFNKMLDTMLKANEIQEKEEETGILS